MSIATLARNTKTPNQSKKTAPAQTKITNGTPPSVSSDNSDFNFRRVDGQCELVGPERIISGECGAPGDIYLTLSGYRKIPGDTCIEPSSPSERKDAPVEKECGKDSDTNLPPGTITNNQQSFVGDSIQYFYLERSETSSGDDETIMMHVGRNKLYISQDGGGTWRPILENEQVVSLYPNPYFHDWVYFVTSDQKVYYTRNRGRTIDPMDGPNGVPITDIPGVTRFSFHPKHAGWLIWVGNQHCDDDGDCHAVAQYTKNAGETWHDLTTYVRECAWIQGLKNSAVESLIYCTVFSTQVGDQRVKVGDLQLVSSADFFDNREVKFDKVIGFANLDEYVVVAFVDDDGQSLRMAVTIDGATFAAADFPPRFSTSRTTAYTVVDSFTKSIFLHITTSLGDNREFGTLMKSNSNGTYYVTSVDTVNRDRMGYVDFEKVQGLEGVALVNIVANSEDVLNNNADKKLKSKVTRNDGGRWYYLTPPTEDSEGKKYDCNGDLEKCSLNLHGYTERKDVRDTYSSGSAVGVLLGVGNVGEFLSPYSEGNTFISDDAGATWREVHKGAYTWEFGDQGGIIVAVKDDAPTDQLLYSEDQGRTWKDYRFTDQAVTVEDIATVPSDTSRKFMIIANDGDSRSQRLAIQVDFTGLHDQKCIPSTTRLTIGVLDVNNPEAGDFELWTPSHPDPEAGKCLFGHEAQYYRRRMDPPAACYVGSKIPQPHRVLRNCTCTNLDYEWYLLLIILMQ
jgi:Sortilin, neurotensin receptor 3,/Sortilin, neurotensin receptor 3, C-terminal